METIYNVIIIGSGPAGLTAAIYTARAQLQPLVIAGLEPGGQLMTTSVIENFPGFPQGIEGPMLMQNMIAQAEKFDTKFVYENVVSVDFHQKPYKIKTPGNEYLTKSVIISVGSKPRRLGLESEIKYWGKGVSTCATCDAAFYKEKVVAVIGGGDSAMEEANTITKFAKKVYLIHRKNEFKASKIMQDKTFANPKIEIVWNSEVREIVGDMVVTGLTLFNNQTNTESELKVDGMFLAIGHIPSTEIVKDQLELDVAEYIKTPDGVHTSLDGVFVAGDVADPSYRQAITASGMGCRAALEAERYLAHLT